VITPMMDILGTISRKADGFRKQKRREANIKKAAKARAKYVHRKSKDKDLYKNTLNQELDKLKNKKKKPKLPPLDFFGTPEDMEITL